MLSPRLTVALLWAGGLAAAVTLWLVRPGPPPSPAGPVRAASEPETRAPDRSAPDVPAPPIPPGPPTVYRGDLRHTGRSPFLGPASPEVVFRRALGGVITAQAVVDADGAIYVGDHAGGFHRLDAHGRIRWTVNLDGEVWATALVVEDRILIGSDAGVLVALDRADGAERWRLEVGAELDTGITLAPDGETVRFAAGATVWAVDLEGRAVWRFDAEDKVFTAPAIDVDGTSYVGSQDDHVYAIAPDGRLRWSYRTGGDVDGSPALGDDGTIYAGSDDRRVYALRRDGTLRWASDVDGYVRAPLAVASDGAVVVGVYGPRPRVVKLDPADGTERWSFRVTLADSTETGVASGPLVDAAGTIHVGAHDDYLYAVTPTGRLRWVVPTQGDVDAPPTLAPDGTLLVGSQDGHLYGLR